MFLLNSKLAAGIVCMPALFMHAQSNAFSNAAPASAALISNSSRLHPTTVEYLTVPADLKNRVIVNGMVDTDELLRIEELGIRERTGVAYYYAARQERYQGSIERSITYFERANSFLPTNANLLANRASALAQVGRYSESLTVAQKAALLDPNSPSILYVLGESYYRTNSMQEAVTALQKSQRIKANGQTSELLAQAKRDLKAEKDFRIDQSAHFTLRYRGDGKGSVFRKNILDQLEIHYSDLSTVFDFTLPARVNVVLYTPEQFRTVTKCPQWSGAVNNGKLRLPIGRFQSLTPGMSNVMKHELTHTFVDVMTGGRVPTWLSEGLAQFMEQRSVAKNLKANSSVFATRRFSTSELEGEFSRFDSAHAVLAYSQSLAAVAYINDRNGLASMLLMLKNIAGGQSGEEALHSAMGLGYAEFDQELDASIRTRVAARP